MRTVRWLVLMLALPATALAAPEEAEDWRVLGGMLGLIQEVLHQAASSPDPGAAQQRIDEMLAGGNPRANQVAAELLRDMFEDMPGEQRAMLTAIARDLLVLARRERARSAPPPEPRSPQPER